MFELHIDDRAVDSGAVPLRWCVSQGTLELARKEQSCVLILVRPMDPDLSEGERDRRETRYVCAVEDMMTFVSFVRPGKNRIYAFLVRKSKRWVKGEYLPRPGVRRPFEVPIVNIYGDDARPFMSAMCTLDDGGELVRSVALLDIDVPVRTFADEPSSFEKWWVNLGYKHPPEDQCEFRSRRIPSYTIKPLLLLGYLLLRYAMLSLLIVVGGFVGVRGEYLRLLRHPFAVKLDDVKFHKGVGSIFFPDRQDEGLVRYSLRIASMPLWLPCGFGFWQLATSTLGATFDWWWGVIGFPFMVLVVMLCLCVVAVFARDRKKAASLPRVQTSRKAVRLSQEEIAYLTCGRARGTAGLSTLPKSRRTIRLHLQDLKRKVCRPFAA